MPEEAPRVFSFPLAMATDMSEPAIPVKTNIKVDLMGVKYSSRRDTQMKIISTLENRCSILKCRKSAVKGLHH
jgi:hypothetical protein